MSAPATDLDPTACAPASPEGTPPSSQGSTENRGPRPFRRRNLAALGLLLGALVGALLSLIIFGGEPSHSWGRVLLHAFEGAIVGGVCDWFAVAKTYHAIQTNRDSVGDAIGEWVANELLSSAVITSRIKALVQDPDVMRELVRAFEERAGTQQDIEAWLLDHWDRIQPTLHEKATQYRFDEDALKEIEATMLDQRLGDAIQICSGTALLDIAEAPELDKLVQVALEDTNWFLKLLGPRMPKRLRAEIRRVGRDLRDSAYQTEGPSKAARLASAAMPPLSHGLAGYVKGWNALTDAQRGDAVNATFGHLRDPLIGMVLLVADGFRHELRNADALVELKGIDALVDKLGLLVNQDVSDRIGDVVSGALRDLAPDVFRRNLEDQTRNHLEMIRINGTILGLAVGAAFGIVVELF